MAAWLPQLYWVVMAAMAAVAAMIAVAPLAAVAAMVAVAANENNFSINVWDLLVTTTVNSCSRAKLYYLHYYHFKFMGLGS